MIQKNTAAYDRLQIDDANDGRRLGLEGGLGTGALVITLVYLLYEALLSPPASAAQASGKESIGNNEINVNPNLLQWKRNAQFSKPVIDQKISALSPVELAGLGISPFSGETGSISNINQENSNTQALNSGRPRSNTSPNSYERPAIQFPQNYAQDYCPFDISAVPTSISEYTLPISRAAEALPSYLVVAVVSTNPNVDSSTISGEAFGENSGNQYGINEAYIVTKGGYDQISAFSERLLETTSRSAENDAIVNQVLQHAGINQSAIDTQGIGGVLTVSASDLLNIAQSSGLTLHTFVDHELAGVQNSEINMTPVSDFVDITSTADIIFRGQSDIDLWNQNINLKSFGLLGKEQTFTGLMSEEINNGQAFLNEDLNPSNTLNTQADLFTELSLDAPVDDSLLPSDVAPQSTDTLPSVASTQTQISDNQLQSTPPIQQSQSPSAEQSSAFLTTDQQQESEINPHSHLNEDLDLDIDISVNSEITEQPTIEDDFDDNIELIPEHTLDLDNGNNFLNVRTNIGDNSSWNAQISDLYCDCPDQEDRISTLEFSVESVAVENYSVLAGDGNDRITLQASVNQKLIEQWTDGIEDFGRSNTSLNEKSISMRRSYLHAGKGDDEITLDGDVVRSTVRSGSGQDTITINGDIVRSTIYSNNEQDNIFVNGDIVKSTIRTGKDEDRLTVNGDIDRSNISMGGSNDVVIMIDPAGLTGKVLGGSGLDTLSFNGSKTPFVIDANLGKVNDLKIGSFEIIEGGEKDDVLWAGEKTYFLDGKEGQDLYILQGDTKYDNLTLELSVSDLLSANEGLVRWDESNDSLMAQIGYQLGIDSHDGITLPDGAEFLPIANLDTLLFSYGVDAPNLGAFAGTKTQWAIATDLLGDEQPGLIEIGAELDNGYRLLAALQQSTVSEDDSVVA